MKTKHMFTPSPKFLTVMLFSTSAFLLSGCSNFSTAVTDESVQDAIQQESSISGFRDQLWGTSFADVESSVITSNMEKGIDYDAGNESGYHMLSLTSVDVGGHSAAAAYVFQDDMLSFGVYQLAIDNNVYPDLFEKYSDKYGDPAAQSEDSGWGSCAVWVDPSRNYICLSDFMDSVLYVSAESPYTEQLADTLSQYQDIDLDSVLGQSGNTSGV